MRYKNGNSFKSTAIAIIAIVTFIVWFIKKVIRAGRLREFFISTPLLMLTYLALCSLSEYIGKFEFIWIASIFISPLIVYSFYWIYLFSHEKITSSRVSLNWANRSWWWTLDGWEFEEEVARIFRLNGYKAKVTKKTGDGGIDIIMYKDNEKYIVQCKHYQSPIPIEPVRALNGLREDFGADKLIMVASSGLSKAGYEFLENKPYYTTIDLEELISMGLRPLAEIDDNEDVIDVKCVEVKEDYNSIPIPDFLN